MEYEAPELRELGSFAELTLGMNGSCLDGNGQNIIQLGGGYQGACGVSGDANGTAN